MTTVDQIPNKGKKAGLEEICAAIERYESFVVVSHLRPDGDALGSMLGLGECLKSIGKKVALYNSTDLGGKWSFLDGVEGVKMSLPEWVPDATIMVDCGSLRRVSDAPFEPKGFIINIDHHLTNDQYGDLNWIDVDACAVGEQIYRVCRHLRVPMTRTIASALYLSIMTDTGGFRYSNTTPRCLRMAAELIEHEVDGSEIAQAVFESRQRGELALTAVAYGAMRYEFNGLFAWSELLRRDYEANGGYEMEPEGLASDIRGVVGVEISCLFHEMEDGTTRAGFRGKGRIDCSAIAHALGGGGHFNASGVVLRGLQYEEAREKVLGVVRAAMDEYVKAQRAAV